MDKLPYELLSSIFSHLSNEDIINLPYSLSCPGLTHADIATRFHQQIEDISIDEAGLRSLLRAARNPLIGPTITKLDFGFHSKRLRYPYEDDFQRHHQKDHVKARQAREKRAEETNVALFDREHGIHAPTLVRMGSVLVPKWRCCTPQALVRKYAHYRKVSDLQWRFVYKEEDLRVLTRAMGFLPTVTDVVIGGSDLRTPDRTEKAKSLLGDAWFSDCVEEQTDFDAHLMQLLLRSLAGSGLKVRRFGIEEWDLDFDLGALCAMVPRGVYPAAFGDLVVLGLNSVYFQLDHIVKYQRWREGERDTNSEYGDRSSSPSVGESTMRIRDHPMMDAGAEPPDLALTVTGLTKALAAMLSSCPLIEDLTLSCSNSHRPYRCEGLLPNLPLLKMLGGNPLSRLRKLTLAYFRLEEDQLVGTLLLCASTLQHLYISDVVLDRGTWESAMDSLRGQLHLAPAEMWRYSVFSSIYGMGPEMKASVKAHGIRKPRYAFRGEEPYEVHISDVEARDWLGGKLLMVNPVWEFMQECATRAGADEDSSDSDEAAGNESDEDSWSDSDEPSSENDTED